MPSLSPGVNEEKNETPRTGTHRTSRESNGVFIRVLWYDQILYIEAPVSAVL